MVADQEREEEFKLSLSIQLNNKTYRVENDRKKLERTNKASKTNCKTR